MMRIICSRSRCNPAANKGSDYGWRPASTDLRFPWSYQCHGVDTMYENVLSHAGIFIIYFCLLLFSCFLFNTYNKTQ